MKIKQLILLFAILIPITLFSQDMPSVAGVEFGSTYESCKITLDNRYNGGTSSYQSENNTLCYNNVNFGGESFDYVNFCFQNDGNKTYLYYIEFVSRFNLTDAKYAKDQRDRLFSTFKEKYDFRWKNTDSDGFICYVLGHDPQNKENGFVAIQTEKRKTKGGDEKIWTVVSYGPVKFINVTDEI